MFPRLAFAFALLAALPQPSAARPLVPHSARDRAFARDFERLLRQGMRRFGTIPAISAAVVRRERPLFVGALGWADREHGRRATLRTRFYIASSTKSFVALAYARLAEEGRVSLDWTLAGLAPDIAFPATDRAGEVTVRALLSHSHGLAGDALQFRLAYSGDYDRPTLMRLVSRLQPNDRAPLGTFRYSNLGYNVAALLLEPRLGADWRSLVEREVVEPLRLRDTAARGLARPADRARPYDGTRPLYLVKDDSTMQSAGGMESSARDMAAWLRFNLAAEAGREDALGRAAALAHRPVVPVQASFGPFARTGYGLGWYSGPYRGVTVYHAFGGFTGFRAHVSFAPAADLGIAVLTNDEGAGDPFTDIAAAYAYDWFLAGPKVAGAEAESRIKALQEKSATAGKRAGEDEGGPLPRPSEFYLGRFCNADWGRVVIGRRGGRLEVAMGRLHAAAKPTEPPEILVAELIPGQPARLRFEPGVKQADALSLYGARFERCDAAPSAA